MLDFLPMGKSSTLERPAVQAVAGEQTAVCRRVNDAGDECGKPLDTSGYPLWCKACRAAHRRGYESTRDEMSETRGFAAGASAMQAALAAQFQASGGMFNGPTAAGWVRKFRLQNPVK